MMMKKQKFLSLVGAILMAISLSACGNGTTQADGQTGATEKKQTVASVDANAGASIKGPASGKTGRPAYEQPRRRHLLFGTRRQ